LIYPDLWKVPVYKKVGNKYVLKSINEISQSIKDYLRQVVKQYNQELKIQLTKRNSYYNQHKKAFDFLAQLDIQATPSRTYSLLPEDYLIKTL
jgi:DNA-binding transcriptional regulator GbsR (MarR family)